MIFITTGTQFPFERLLKIMDEWAQENSETEVIAQVGLTEFKSKFIESYDYLTPVIYESYVKKANVLVGHLW
ncbi:hypothetical protein L3081_21325 [Colwellia sp. MSW7]|uniref:Uncharacterized protein n=1 Tax=Colwellia maritima TaxID=2912588 RepID=A0ABS9X5G3_9GAMM|nr:hypothetical protein [Colwellia maritima]MCI2285469.1 hypothetical protein [Colwellia maritima]